VLARHVESVALHPCEALSYKVDHLDREELILMLDEIGARVNAIGMTELAIALRDDLAAERFGCEAVQIRHSPECARHRNHQCCDHLSCLDNHLSRLSNPFDMKDKAGIVITVDCRVAEADFSYGDGTVESVTVPCIGGELTDVFTDRDGGTLTRRGIRMDFRAHAVSSWRGCAGCCWSCWPGKFEFICMFTPVRQLHTKTKLSGITVGFRCRDRTFCWLRVSNPDLSDVSAVSKPFHLLDDNLYLKSECCPIFRRLSMQCFCLS
jgi:hypothetical protein